jgi:mono/diheme cytochrome c family protein
MPSGEAVPSEETVRLEETAHPPLRRPGEPRVGTTDSTQGVAPAVLVPGGDEQADQGDRNQSEHDAAEEGFNHGESPQGAWAHSFTAHSLLATVSRSVTGPSPLAASASPPAAVDGPLPEASPPRGRRLLTLLALVAGLAVLLFSLVVLLPALRADPYTRATLQLRGDVGNGGRLFRLNCAGCHGLAAQGLVGPNLHGVGQRKNDRQLIQQVVSGRTPPMPRFQPDPQTMADLLAFLHSLP